MSAPKYVLPTLICAKFRLNRNATLVDIKDGSILKLRIVAPQLRQARATRLKKGCLWRRVFYCDAREEH